jgi:hypothetical protein
VTGVRADLVAAAHNVAEAALRLVKVCGAAGLINQLFTVGQVGGKNAEVTEGVAKVIAEYGGAVKGVEGKRCASRQRPALTRIQVSSLIRCAFKRSERPTTDVLQQIGNNIQAKKTISLFPTSDQKLDKDNNHVFEEGEVYSINALVTTASDPKVRCPA